MFLNTKIVNKLIKEAFKTGLMSKHRKERIKNQIIGIDKVRARIKRMML